MKEYLKTFLSAIGAGVAITIGGIVYLSVENKVVGALLFTVGLYMIVLNGLSLYTGKVGYLPMQEQKGAYLMELFFTWLGNLIGIAIGVFMIRLARIQGIREGAEAIAQIKLADSAPSIFCLAILCGILMYVAVDGYRRKEQPLILFLCVSVFILCGFEHCIANMFYFILAGTWTLKACVYLVVMTLGNGLGGMIIPIIKLKMTE
ncbi:formate/nitrite transporter family protein [Lachnospiraceae bacterium OttesenSCG-928-J05]|nr:formate/nitrite transporter family protein [Lachnospiraceae bacterium OttesenSCG-928-J05]